MEKFYHALAEIEEMDNEEIAIIKSNFIKEKIRVKHLPRLTDEKLKKCGIWQGGLRESILMLLGKT